MHLLTVVDESEVEETHTGTPVSAPLPQATGAGLTLPIDQPVAPTVEGRDQAIARVRSERVVYLEALAEELLDGLPYKCIIEIGEPAEKIVEVAEHEGAGGIAMGTRSKRSRFASAVFGSVAEAVVRAANVPVLVVKHGTVVPTDE